MEVDGFITCVNVVSKLDLSSEPRALSHSIAGEEGLGLNEAAREAAAETTDATITSTVDTTGVPFSKSSKSPRANNASSPEKSGINLVHQNTIFTPLSRTRCFTINSTTRTKNANAVRISTRSSQSVFSRAVTSCLEVPRMLVSVSWVEEVERRVAVEESISSALLKYSYAEVG
jgi:hypothetical protein